MYTIADDIVDRVAVDRHAGIPLFEHDLHDRLAGHVDVERHDIGPRDHHFLRRRVGELEDALDQLLFGLVDDARSSSPPRA